MIRNIFFVFVFIFASVPSVVDARRGYENKPKYGSPNDYLVYSDEAEDIMGERFYGQKKMEKFFGFRISRSLAGRMYEVPFKKSTLARCDNCILFYYLPYFGPKYDRSTIKNFLYSKKRRIKKSFSSNRLTSIYKNQKFANRAPKEGWYLINTNVRGAPVRVLTGNFSLSPREKISRAAVYVYAMLLDRNLFRGKYVLTSDKSDARKNSILVGRPNGKIEILSLLRTNLGIAPEIIPDTNR